MKTPAKAERRAEALLRDLDLRRPPVPVLDIAKKLGVRVAFEPLEPEVSAMLYRRANQSLVIVNSVHAQVRQRFSLAHEIGHFLLHDNQQVFVDQIGQKPAVRVSFRDERSSSGTHFQEIQANSFAAALLMPERWVLDYLDRISKTLDHSDYRELVPDLATRFEVSQDAIRYRLTNLGFLGIL